MVSEAALAVLQQENHAHGQVEEEVIQCGKGNAGKNKG